MAREALELAEQRGWSQHPSVACAYLVLVGAHFEWGDLDAAQRYLDLGVACRPEPAISVAIALAQAVVSYAKGDPAAGLELLRRAQLDLRRLNGPHAMTVSLREWEARLLAATRRIEQAKRCSHPPRSVRFPRRRRLRSGPGCSLLRGMRPVPWRR